jgi:hypothetical protein
MTELVFSLMMGKIDKMSFNFLKIEGERKTEGMKKERRVRKKEGKKEG